MKQKLRLAFFALAICICFTGSLMAEKPIRVGICLPMTGPVGMFGQDAWRGLQLANKNRSAILGREVRLRMIDTESDSIKTAETLSRLINEEKADGIIGPLASSNAISAAPVAEKAGVPMILPWSTNPALTPGRKYIFRACSTSPFHSQVIAKYFREDLKAETAALFMDVKHASAVNFAMVFVKRFEALGGKVVFKGKLIYGQRDFSAVLKDMLKTKPDAIYLPLYIEELAHLIRQAKEMGIKQTLVSVDAAQDENLFKIAGKAAEGLAFITHFDPEAVETDSGKKFLKSFAEAYPGVAPQSCAALSYDAYNILLDAMTRAGTTDKEKVAAAIAETENYEGVTGVMTMNETHDMVKPAVILTVKDGKFKWLTTVKP